MTIDTKRFAFVGGGPYIDRMEAERQIHLYYRNVEGIQTLRDDDTGKWHIVRTREKE